MCSSSVPMCSESKTCLTYSLAQRPAESYHLSHHSHNFKLNHEEWLSSIGFLFKKLVGSNYSIKIKQMFIYIFFNLSYCCYKASPRRITFIVLWLLVSKYEEFFVTYCWPRMCNVLLKMAIKTVCMCERKSGYWYKMVMDHHIQLLDTYLFYQFD